MGKTSGGATGRSDGGQVRILTPKSVLIPASNIANEKWPGDYLENGAKPRKPANSIFYVSGGIAKVLKLA